MPSSPRVPRCHTRAQFSVSTLPQNDLSSFDVTLCIHVNFFFSRVASIPYKGEIMDGNWKWRVWKRRFAVSVILVHCVIYCVDQPEKKKSNMQPRIASREVRARDTLRNIHGTLAVTQCREVNWKKCRAARCKSRSISSQSEAIGGWIFGSTRRSARLTREMRDTGRRIAPYFRTRARYTFVAGIIKQLLSSPLSTYLAKLRYSKNYPSIRSFIIFTILSQIYHNANSINFPAVTSIIGRISFNGLIRTFFR